MLKEVPGTNDGMTYDDLAMGLLYRNAIGMRIQNEYKGAKHDEVKIDGNMAIAWSKSLQFTVAMISSY